MYSAEQRQEIVAQVVKGLSAGTPLAVLCRGPGMPDDDTIRNWMGEDETVARAIARAREVGHDAIAMEALAIQDAEPERMNTEVGDRVDPAAVAHQKNRAELRLKLLAKWDPKRYGDKLQHAGHDGEALKLTISSEDAGL